MTSEQTKISLAIFASGKGSNAQKIIDYFRDHPKIKVSLIVSSKPTAGVIEIAENENIPYFVIDAKTFRETGYAHEVRSMGVDWVILAGFLWKVPEPLLLAYPSKIINIHPSLLPAFGGKGMYGMAVHTAVIAAGEKHSGITIHIIDEEYDRGAVILQKQIDIESNETAESLAIKIHKLEHEYFPKTIEQTVLNSVRL